MVTSVYCGLGMLRAWWLSLDTLLAIARLTQSYDTYLEHVPSSSSSSSKRDSDADSEAEEEVHSH